MPRKSKGRFAKLENGYRQRIQNGHSVSSISAETGISRLTVRKWKLSHIDTTYIKRVEERKHDNLLQTEASKKHCQATKRKRTCTSLSVNAMVPGSKPKISKTDGADLGLSDEQNTLNTQWTKLQMTRKGIQIVQSNCDTICTYIRNKSNNILDVWPAYDSKEKNSIKFVVTTKEGTDLKEMKLEYATVVRPIRKYSGEDIAVMETDKDRKYILSDDDSEKIRATINKHAKKLMQNHRYLSVITGSGVRSKGFESNKHRLIREACIVMYVKAKGNIPLDEKELPSSLDGIAVDVREGEFHNCVSACGYQTPLRNGCQIACQAQIGTLGCFLHHPHYGLCAITCAHVVLNDNELRKFRRVSKKLWLTERRYVYQPDRNDEMRNNCGQVKETIYKSGGRNTSGVDLAVVQIEQRPPDSGYFPDSNVPICDISKFDSGRVCSSVNENNNWVTKFGASTGKTEGYVMFSDAVVKQIDHDHGYRVFGRAYTYTLHHQYEVRSTSNVHFVGSGDSGAAVFKKDPYGELLCLGMVVGQILPRGQGVVTPISSIMSELGVSEFMNFKQGGLESRLAVIESEQRRMNEHLSNIGRRQINTYNMLRRLQNPRRR